MRGKGILHRIGNILHVSKTKNIILKAENIPHIGDKVTDEKLRTVGTVFDVFGPASSPYVAVKPNIHKSEQLTNQVLYSDPSNHEGNKRKRR